MNVSDLAAEPRVQVGQVSVFPHHHQTIPRLHHWAGATAALPTPGRVFWCLVWVFHPPSERRDISQNRWFKNRTHWELAEEVAQSWQTVQTWHCLLSEKEFCWGQVQDCWKEQGSESKKRMHELCYFYQWLNHLLCSPLWLHALLHFGSVVLWVLRVVVCHSSISWHWLWSRMRGTGSEGWDS